MDETNVCASIMFITKLKHVLYALDSFLMSILYVLSFFFTMFFHVHYCYTSDNNLAINPDPCRHKQVPLVP